jgi:flagellar M-ring protein FliF
MEKTLTQLPVQFVSGFNKLPAGRKIGLIVLAAAAVAAFILMLSWTGKQEMGILYSNLEQGDAAEIVAGLKERKIPYRIGGNGNTVFVPEKSVYELRMEFASQGRPSGGSVGFEIFDDTKLGMTEFVQNVNFQRALQGELSRTISGFHEVERCRVHIVMPKKSLFLSQEEAARASVVLKLVSGRVLSGQQTQGIVHLVSSSVPGLIPQNVTVVDSGGQILAGNRGKSEQDLVNTEQLEYMDRYERNLENRITSMLDRVLGPDRVIARVSCAFDFSKVEMTEEKFSPENQVARSEQLLQSTTLKNRPAGIPNQAPEEGEEGEDKVMLPTFTRNDRIVNYEIGRTTSRTVAPVGQLERLSVAVVVDGVPKPVEGRRGKSEPEIVPRSPEELLQLENLVKKAVNFNSDRGDQVEIASIPFEQRGLDGEFETDSGTTFLDIVEKFGGILRYVVFGVFLVLTFVMVVRPVVRWVTGGGRGGMEFISHLPKTVGEIEQEYGMPTGALPYREKALQMVQGDSESSLRVIRKWIESS